MENMEEIERQIMEIVINKHNKTGGHNGSTFNEFEHIFQDMSPSEKMGIFQKMAEAKKIVIREGANKKMIMLPK